MSEGEEEERRRSRAASVVGIPKISRYTNFFQISVFLKLG